MRGMEDAPNVQYIDADELTDDDLATLAAERGYELRPVKAWHQRFWVRVVLVVLAVMVLLNLSFLFMSTGSSGP
jgi:hypothetical protein